MARKYTFVCDGCGVEKTSKEPDRPRYWADVNIRVEGYTNWQSGGGEDQYLLRLLCSSCQITLQLQCDPSAWARKAEAE